MPPFDIVYVTASEQKREENQILANECVLPDGTAVSSACRFVIREASIKETLEVDLDQMVRAEVLRAYERIRLPCIVEHAGLIFEEHRAAGYPGGLTKPMWAALQHRFVEETGMNGKRAVARAVVAYCDGQRIWTFTGETAGVLATPPRGRRDFYWDCVFVPDDASGKLTGKTYAEIADDPHLGLRYKVVDLSQSTKAILQFVEFRRRNGAPALWPP